MYTETILSGSGSIAVPFQMQGPSADNPILCAQFLRGYTDLEILKNIRPEDIEDISERFLPLWQENRDSDSVKRIRRSSQTG